jgi:hypothetical protein
VRTGTFRIRRNWADPRAARWRRQHPGPLYPRCQDTGSFDTGACLDDQPTVGLPALDNYQDGATRKGNSQNDEGASSPIED